MNISPWTIYWITRLDVILGISGILIFALLVTFGIWMCETGQRIVPAMKYLLIPFIPLSIIITCVPSTKDMAAIIIIPKIVNNEKVERVGNYIYDAAIKWVYDHSNTKKCDQDNSSKTKNSVIVDD